MLELKNIIKTYTLGKPGDSNYQCVEALKGVSIQFRDTEFVSILGPSGCGKTTLLNIIGGLDRYTSGIFLLKIIKIAIGITTVITKSALSSKVII